MEQRVEQRVAHFLHHVGGAGVAHERRAGVAADHRARKRRRDVDSARTDLGQVHALVVGTEEHQRRAGADGGTHRLVVGFHTRTAREREAARQPHLVFEEVAQAARVGLVGVDAEGGGAEEVLRDRAPQVPQRLDRGVLLALDERLGIDTGQFAQRAQEARGAVQADRRLQVGPVERLAQQPAELAIHADVDVGIGQLLDVGQVRAQREHHVDVAADALDQPLDLGQVARHVEGAVARPDDVDARPFAVGARLALGNMAQPVLGPQPVQRAIGALPLVFVNRARQETLDVAALGCDTAADHLGDRAGDNHRRQVGVEHLVRAAHGALGALLPEFLFGQTGDDDRQLVWRQRVGVVQHRGHRQVLAADRTVDDHLQALDGREHIHGAPVAAGTIVVDDQHQIISSALRLRAAFSTWRR